MNISLSGKTAVITGGNVGIGKAIALCFAKAGANIALLATNKERGESVAQELSAFTKAIFYQVDVSKTEAVKEVMTQILAEFGGIDILVNNAGITKDALLMKMSEEDWDIVLDVNLKSVYNTCHALIRHFIKAKKGKIINITSVVGLTGNAGQVNYAASKSGMIGFTKSLAKELATRNICVNCIAPGFIDTNMTDVLTETQKASILGQIPMQKLGQPDDIAKAALFLASDLSDYVTGHVLPVDGGMVMGM